MSLKALPGQVDGPQSTDQVLPSWLSYSAYTTLTQTYTKTRQTVLYDPSGSLGPTLSATVEVGVTTDTLYVARPLPLLYTGPTPYPDLGTLYTVSRFRVGFTSGAATPTSSAGNSASGPGQSSGLAPSSAVTPAPVPSGSSPRPSSSTNSVPQTSGNGAGSNTGSTPTQSAGGSGSSTVVALPPGATSSAGTTFIPSGTSVVGGTTYLPGSTGGTNPTSIVSGTAVGPTQEASPTLVSGTTFFPGSTSLASGTTFLPGSTSIYSGTTFVGGTSTIPSSTDNVPGGGTPLQRQSSGLTPAQLAGTLVSSILGFLLLLALLLCCLLKRQRRRQRLEQTGFGSEKYGAGISNDPAEMGYGAAGPRGTGEKSALLGLGAAGAGAGAAAAATSNHRSPSWSNWLTSRGNRIPSDSAVTGGAYTALPPANVGAAGAGNPRNGRTGSGGSTLGAGLAGASAAAVAAMATVSSRRRRRREERERAGAGPWGGSQGGVNEVEWEADGLHDDGGSGFFIVVGRQAAGRVGGEGYHDDGVNDQITADPFADSPDETRHAEHRAEGIAAAAGAAVVAAGRGRNMSTYSNDQGLMVNDPALNARKTKYHDMANLGRDSAGGSGSRFFGAMKGNRSASGTESGTGSNSNSGPSQRNASSSRHVTPGTQQPSARSVSNLTQHTAAQDNEVSTHSGAAGAGVIYGLGAAAGAAALGLAHAARRMTSGERRLSRKPVPQYASSSPGTDSEAEGSPAYMGKRKGAYDPVGTVPVGEEDEGEEDDQPGPGQERQGLMGDYGADPYDRAGPYGRANPSPRTKGSYRAGKGWPQAALVGAAAGAATGAGATAATRRSHRRANRDAEGQGSSGSGSGDGTGPWSSGSTHEAPKSSNGALLSGSSAGHRSGSTDDVTGWAAGFTSLHPPPRPPRSRTSTSRSLKDPSSLTLASSSPQDRARLPTFPEGFGEGDLHARAGSSMTQGPQAGVPSQATDLLRPEAAALTTTTAAGPGTGGALGLLASQHRTSTEKMYDYHSEGHSQSVRTPDESELPSRHSDFLSRGTHLLGPGAAVSSRSSATSSGAGGSSQYSLR
ncbi:unnamed protein product [Tilletia controversa]|uniref:Uncharacterized protein n=1 Tax=Tilletia controversa TaxID=13291 RepID=A0A8X7MPU5_9BASI|nr:hypothetical protein CF328_g5536 [Tilletia controversa]KAE8243012.1 hypothetical protein A4X06_0g6614 [Tilletia controversa]CAD6944345.1 unnamed protein product [Tilletia controversa]